MRDIEFSDFGSIDLMSSKSDQHSSPKHKEPPKKRKHSLRQPSVLLNLMKGKFQQALNPYQHYQKLKL